MLYKEIIAVCSHIHTKHINTLCGQKVEFVNVKLALTYRNKTTVKTTAFLLQTISVVTIRYTYQTKNPQSGENYIIYRRKVNKHLFS